MTKNPQPSQGGDQHGDAQYGDAQQGPFVPPLVAEMRDDPLVATPIDRESLSTGGRVAWLVIAAVVSFMVISTALYRSGEESRTEASESDLFPVQLEARAHIGQRNFFGGTQRAKDSDSEEGAERGEDKSPYQTPIPETLNDGTYEQRLCYVLLVSETEGPQEAAEKLTALDEAAAGAEFELNEAQGRLRSIVGQLIQSFRRGDFDAASVTEEDRDFLKEKLGWIGELGLVPAGTRNAETRKELLADASWSMGLMMASVLGMLLMMMAGVVLAAILAVLFATGKLRAKFFTRAQSLNIYIETFAIWLVVFFGGPQVIGYLFHAIDYEPSTSVSLGVQVGFFFGSLIVLVYPWLRGIPLRQICDDIGWKIKGSFVDFLIAPMQYVAGAPLMFAGLMCVLALTLIVSIFSGPKPFGTSIAAGHPIQEIVTNGQWWNMLYIVLMACIAAPIVEETMFRGVLYRHLRELSRDWARWGSVIFSAIFNGLIFAAIHPQGFIAIPLLTMLAVNFSLAREWRDSLLAPVLMHAINNGTVTCFMFLMI